MYYFAFLQTQQLKWQKQLQGKITFMSSLTVFFVLPLTMYWQKHIGQKFKREVIIKNLEPLNKPLKNRDTVGPEVDDDLALVALFAKDS